MNCLAMPDQPALFLDRDGVINFDAGYTYKIEEFRFIDGIFDLCRLARELGYVLVVATNQSGIGRGLFTEAEFQRLTAWMRARFVAQGAPLAAVYHCPYHPEGDNVYAALADWRKPAPGMLLQAAKDLQLDLSRSLMIGDSQRDVTAARAASLAGCVLLGDPAQPASGADAVFATHAEITAWLRRFSKTDS